MISGIVLVMALATATMFLGMFAGYDIGYSHGFQNGKLVKNLLPSKVKHAKDCLRNSYSGKEEPCTCGAEQRDGKTNAKN